MSNFDKTKFPLVFVHGMFGWGDNEGLNEKAPYWGGTTGSLTEYLSGEGVECYAASVGPISSGWDRVCELYAQLKGTRVDYGEYHSRIYGHKRFGRTYKEPLFENWSEEKKVHLIGHSFGGNTIRLLVHLLKYGAPEEVDISGEDTSPLFIGGQENLVCSITAICSPLNGTDAYETARRYKLIAPIKFLCFNYAGILGRTKFQGNLVDFHLEQFGVNGTTDERYNKKFSETVRNLFQSKDQIEYDMSEMGAEEMNKVIKIVPSVYYFSYPYNAVAKNKKGKIAPVNTKNMLLKVTSNLMLKNNERAKKFIVGNDGLVDVLSAMYPKNEPYKCYSLNEQFDAGIWNVMPLRKGDHGTPIGLFADKEKTYKFYNELVSVLATIESNNFQII